MRNFQKLFPLTYNFRVSSPVSHAFTLIETLVVISMLAIFVNLSVVSGIDSFDRGLARTDRALLLASLREARAEAMDEVCSSPNCTASPAHGVHVSQNEITLFEGSSYASRYAPADVSMAFSAQEIISKASGMSVEVVFAPESGNSQSISLAITGIDNRTETVQVNALGAISDSFSP